MIRTFIVKNFRCFSSLSIGTGAEPLARVNLIAGKNNSGKTALLEAIYLHCQGGDIRIPFQLNGLRGIEFKDHWNLVGFPPYAPELVSWLFPGRVHNPNFRIETISYDTDGKNHSLQLGLMSAIELRLHYRDLDRALQDAFRPEIWQPDTPRLVVFFEYEGKREYTAAILGGHDESGLNLLGYKIPWSIPCKFLATHLVSNDHIIRWYSAMEVAKRQDELLPPLQILEPRLKRLSLNLFAGQPVIHADVGLEQLLPVFLVGEGFRKLLTLLLSMTSTQGGVVLVDEIENGVHHSVMQAFWRAISQFAQKENVQVFATTHSYECIQAAHEAFEPQSDEAFRLLRLDREGNDIRVVPWFRRNIETAVEMNMEMR